MTDPLVTALVDAAVAFGFHSAAEQAVDSEILPESREKMDRVARAVDAVIAAARYAAASLDEDRTGAPDSFGVDEIRYALLAADACR